MHKQNTICQKQKEFFVKVKSVLRSLTLSISFYQSISAINKTNCKFLSVLTTIVFEKNYKKGGEWGSLLS